MKSENRNNWMFQLFVSGNAQNTDEIVSMLKQICEKHLQGLCKIEVIDVIQEPAAGMAEDIIATPTLLKKAPKPARRIIGDIRDKDKLMAVLDIAGDK